MGVIVLNLNLTFPFFPSSVLSKIRHFNDKVANNEAKLHVAKIHVMPSITLTNTEHKLFSIANNSLSDSTESLSNLKDYYGDDEKGKISRFRPSFIC